MVNKFLFLIVFNHRIYTTKILSNNKDHLEGNNLIELLAT